jgi:outer membrane autotransporter protein
LKKFIFIAALFAATTASAVELGINASRDMSNSDRNGYGITLGQKTGKVGVTAGFDRYTTGTDLDKYTLVGSYDVAKFGGVTVAAKAGAAYLNQKSGNDGYAWLVGAGVEYPVAKSVSLTADYRYQVGQSRVSSLDGSTVSAGIKYSF